MAVAIGPPRRPSIRKGRPNGVLATPKNGDFFVIFPGEYMLDEGMRPLAGDFVPDRADNHLATFDLREPPFFLGA